MIKPNHHELGELFGVQLADVEKITFYAKRLQEMGAENVLVSNIRPYFKKIYFANELAGASNDVLCFVGIDEGSCSHHFYSLMTSEDCRLIVIYVGGELQCATL